MPLNPRRVKALFLTAADLADPAERVAFLDRECGDDPDLRQRLDDLLAANDRPADELERPLAAIPVAPEATEGRAESPTGEGRTVVVADQTVSFRPEDPPPASVVGTIIAGRYKIRQEIGEGGMGSVYLAEQTRPVKRQVALKLIKAGMDSRTVLARFESERQALALMDHPHIAKVLDAGSTEQGRPFFVMELVKGIPLTDYCDRHQLDLSARLALFRQICSAVQHAHQKGIIHRDLKPTNILVESHDDKPVPKVIDFGLAKATSGMQLSEHSLFTAFGSVTGTPLYMAPEQATFNALDVDTRADIYALGVILYELLTGSTPIARDTIKRAALDEMLRVIREDEPPTPSSRVGTSEGLPRLAANRHVEPGRLSRLIRGDLDWIVMKALAKERDRRYDSAIDLSNDIERFLNHEPVTAGPPDATYRLRKFVRRNRGQVAAAALVLLALVAGVVGTTLSLIEARRQEAIAVEEAALKEKARLAEAEQRKIADDQRRRAERRLGQVAKMNEILGSIFKDLDPKNAEKDGKPLSAVLGERLDGAVAEIEGDATGDPLVVARIQTILGQSLLGLGYAEKAIGVLNKARATLAASLGEGHPETLAALGHLAGAYQAAGQLDRALPIREEVVATAKARLGPGHPDTLAAMDSLARAYQAAGQLDRALLLLEEALATAKANLGPDRTDTLAAMDSLAGAYQAAGRLDRALPMREEALARARAKLGPEHPDTILVMINLAMAYQAAAQLDRALPLYEEAVAAAKAKLGVDHPDTIVAMANLAWAYKEAGQPGRALPMLEEVLAARTAKFGPEHPDTISSLGLLAWAYKDTNKFGRALPMLEAVLAARKARLGPEHPDTLAAMGNLAWAYAVARQFDRALPMLEGALASRKARLGPDHADTISSMGHLGWAYKEAGQPVRALPLYEEVVAARMVKLGPDHPDTLAAIADLALAYKDSRQLDRALPMYEGLVATRRAKLGPDHPDTISSMGFLAWTYKDAGQLEKAATEFERTLALQKSRLGLDHRDTYGTVGNLAGVYFELGKADRAFAVREAFVNEVDARFGSDHDVTLRARDDLATEYRYRGRLPDTFPIRLATLKIREAKLGPDHPDTLDNLQFLVIEYRLAGRHSEAAEGHNRLQLKALEAKLGTEHEDTIAARQALGAACLEAGHTAEAIGLYESVLRSRSAQVPADEAKLADVRQALANAFNLAGQFDRARPLLRELVDRRKSLDGPDSRSYALALALLGLNLSRAGTWPEAESTLRECLAIREKIEPDSWTTSNAQSMLGGALLGQGRRDEAAPLLVAGYEGLRARADKIPALYKQRLAEALDRLIALAEATGKPDEARAWREEKAKLAGDPPPKPDEGKK